MFDVCLSKVGNLASHLFRIMSVINDVGFEKNHYTYFLSSVLYRSSINIELRDKPCFLLVKFFFNYSFRSIGISM